MRDKPLKAGIINRLFVEPSNNISIQFFRYLFVGGTAFIVDFGTIYLLTLIDFFKELYFIPVSIAFILGLITNYTLSILWIFRSRKVSDKRLEFIVFGMVGLAGLFLNWLFIWLFTDIVFADFIIIHDKQARILIGKIISTVIVYLWNFFARKLILFRG